ncbi:MAG: PilZ domain-containing protein [Planctomycetota bacterium]
MSIQTRTPMENRREHERFALNPMYTEIALRLMDEGDFSIEGHAYDVSEGGIQIEIDRPLEPGTEVAVRIMLPDWQHDTGPGRAVFAVGRIVWFDDDGVHGPVRTAVAFRNFCRVGDRERLMRQLVAGRYARAA